jgi:hypothetical protein
MLRTVARFSNLDVEDWIDCALGPNWVIFPRLARCLRTGNVTLLPDASPGRLHGAGGQMQTFRFVSTEARTVQVRLAG